MPTTIMTAKIARRGIRVPSEYFADFLDQVTVGDVMIPRGRLACRRDWYALPGTIRDAIMRGRGPVPTRPAGPGRATKIRGHRNRRFMRRRQRS